MSDARIQAFAAFVNRPNIVLIIHIIVLIALLNSLLYIKSTWNLEDVPKPLKRRRMVRRFLAKKRREEDIVHRIEIVQGRVIDDEDRRA